MRTARPPVLTAGAVVVGIVLFLALYGPTYLDDASFRAAQRRDSANAADYEARGAGYQEYLRTRPNGRHADAARQQLDDLNVAAEKARKQADLDAVLAAVDDVVRTGAYEDARSRLRQAVKSGQAEPLVLQELALISWGFDRFDRGAWEQSQGYVSQLLTADSSNEIALAIAKHNKDYRPVDPPHAQGGMSRIECRDSPIQFMAGQGAVNPGETAVFSSDGTLKTLTRGSTTFGVQRGGSTPKTFTDGTGAKYMYTAGVGDFGLVALQTITSTRRQALGAK